MSSFSLKTLLISLTVFFIGVGVANAAPQGSDCGEATQVFSCTDQAPLVVPVSINFTASPVSIYQGQSSVLTWNTGGAEGCSLGSGPGTQNPFEAGVVGQEVPLNGSVTVYPSETTTYLLMCNNGSYGLAGETATITVSPAPQADLTPGATSGSATAGASATISGTVTNVGQTATGAGFSNLIQIDDDTAEDWETYAQLNASSVGSSLGAGASAPVSVSYTFPSAGTWYARICADLPPVWTGVIAESNEGNNCGSWSPITVASPSPMCRNGIDDDADGATDYPADAGCTNADDTTESPNPMCSNGIDDDGDGAADYPADTGCTSAADTTESPNPPAVPTASLSANPITVALGGSSLLTWSSSNATSCTGTGFTAGGTSGTRSVSPSTPGANSYGVTCSGAGGTSVTSYATVTVVSPTAYLTAEPTLVKGNAPGGTTNLKWTAVDAASCSLSASPSYSGLSFTSSYAPPAAGTTTTAVTGITKQTDFTLSCTTLAGGTVNSSVQVNIRFDSDEF